MCLIVKKGKKEKIAKEDVVCYKALSSDLKSPCQYFGYELGRTYTTKFTKINCYPYDGDWTFSDGIAMRYYQIYDWKNAIAYQEGFHSYSSLERMTKVCNEFENMFECLIPKGTKYIEDETGLICSEAIIITKILE